MNRITALAASCLVAGSALVACSQEGARDANLGPLAHGAEVNAIADAYLAAIRDIAPFNVLYSGLGEDVPVANDAFDLNTPEAAAAFEAIEDGLLARLGGVDPSELENRASVPPRSDPR